MTAGTGDANANGERATSRESQDAVRITASAAAGAALALSALTGSALLLYAERGALTAGGTLLAVTVGALGGGVWVGRVSAASDNVVPRSAGRWRLAALAVALAAVFAAAWTGSRGVQSTDAWRAGAVVLLLGGPAYFLGLLLVTLHARRGDAAVPALLGAAAAAFVGAVFIARIGAPQVLFGTAVLLTLVGMMEARTEVRAMSANMGPLHERVVLVTGVGRRGQVGFAIAEALLRAGARVVVTHMHDDVETLAVELQPSDRVLAQSADLTRSFEVEQLLDLASERFGRLDGVANVAGGLSVVKPGIETTDEEWHRELERNAFTCFVVTRAALPLLRKSRGAVVNFASPAGVQGAPRMAAYSAAKAAVLAQTRAFALEERDHGVRVNAIVPGMIDTERNRREVADPDQVRWVSREQIADTVVFLLSDAASGLTGEPIHVLGAGVRI